jgi:hypothetical protein
VIGGVHWTELTILEIKLASTNILVLPSSIFSRHDQGSWVRQQQAAASFLGHLGNEEQLSPYGCFADVCSIENVAGKKDWKGKRTSTTMARSSHQQTRALHSTPR